MAELGFFVKELNGGWEEWTAKQAPTHAGRVPVGEVRCECSDRLEAGHETHAPEP